MKKKSFRKLYGHTYINPSRRENWELLEADTFTHNFGILIPCPSGVVWFQQTNGVMCSHVWIEGVFIPMEIPHTEKGKNLLDELEDANYNSKMRKEVIIWKKIKKWLVEHEKIEYDEIDCPNPKNLPENQEGLQWIKITRWDSPFIDRSGFISKKVILIYPNCD